MRLHFHVGPFGASFPVGGRRSGGSEYEERAVTTNPEWHREWIAQADPEALKRFKQPQTPELIHKIPNYNSPPWYKKPFLWIVGEL